MKNTNDPCWKNITEQFEDRKPGTIQHLTNVWAKRMGVPTLNMTETERTVTRDTWTNTQIYDLLKSMEPHEPAMFTDIKPRRTNKPLVLVKSNGVYFMIDGRRRSNVWYKISGKYEVLIVE